MARPKKLNSPIRVDVYMDKERLDRLEQVASFYGMHRQDLIRKALDEFLEHHKDHGTYACPKCDFVLKFNKLSPSIEVVIKEHEQECMALGGAKEVRKGRK